ncbi:uncharacterized protein LOC125235909 [Leguminivora glycinivorella]|uniref:uncharacterized protein LOC125235909 n=1 Tax=Leguminivora glycinivorella TaxID=1035111 RepID=UPI0020107D6D|nr:uncharacterized protein LOC125235909 [Leguminivora glycinivorella]
MDDYDRILQRQREIIDAIQRVETNFKKDSDFRKTEEYLRTRIGAVDTLWEEFEKNNLKLRDAPDQTGEYFVDNVYQQMQVRTDNIRTMLSNYRFGEPSTPIKATDTQQQQQTSKLNELFSEQKTNFRAFQRILNYIDIDKISEKWEMEDELRNLQTRWDTIDTLHLKIDNLLQGSDKDYEERYRGV